MSGRKKILLEGLNFIINFLLFVMLLLIVNGFCLNILNDSKRDFMILNAVLTAIFLLYLLLQNVIFQSCFYHFSHYVIESKVKNQKIRIIIHNLIFNGILIALIIFRLTKVPYFLNFVAVILFILEIVPCFMEKYSQPLSYYLLKLEIKKK